jgi:hypothetical protein
MDASGHALVRAERGAGGWLVVIDEADSDVRARCQQRRDAQVPVGRRAASLQDRDLLPLPDADVVAGVPGEQFGAGGIMC